MTCKKRVLSEEDFAFLAREAPSQEAWSAPTHLPLHEVERRVIEETLRRTGGNVKETAEILQIDRSSLYDRIRRYNISR